ncbi:MAG: SIS domain-containing protein [Chloroflexota bacterium]|jgi:D-inositol-3-phosphate glycosyltransferase
MTQSFTVLPRISNDTRLQLQSRISLQSTLVQHTFDSAVDVLRESRRRLLPGILETAHLLVHCFAAGNKVLVCGNGGSAADAQHFAAELVGRFKSPRRAGLPVIALTSDSAILTAWANDIGYELVFSRQVEALGQAGDVLIVISTSGRSMNIVQAVDAARRQQMRSIALLGRDGGEVLPLSDTALVVPSGDSQRIQEVQMLVLHVICELVEEQIELVGSSLFA